ncbi:phosphoenolpyruvate-protein phosphotransferase [Thermodesulfatator indicus DSM 15286]|uniref:Phosphoenolpyruvate-protein phosphotransferase n=1 Tax=Thermodesulfatator indicus (strain DSM 15286 / JCM 11887 / CIR29812) TaxID=667014 RepID=F8A848_THEID|nr:phosphoenolpyruvate--protein phosphotransferase [Thermodesulfatator indicus]AEH45043.1 phosphoenolpyruvate-protein phosphotransferase [Thermodesulfatator indicus DSM 15286]
MKRLKGIGVSPGIAIGPAFILLTGRLKIARKVLRPEQIEKEIVRFRKALATAVRDLEEVKRHIPPEMTQPLSIIDAHILMLKDPSLIKETEEFIRRYYANAEWALRKVLDKYQKIFSSIDDFYLKERVYDLEHLIERVILALKGKNENFDLEEPAIVVARDLSPADTARLKPETTYAFVTEMGSRTSHTAIVARSLGIPAVVAVSDLMNEVSPDDLLIVDGLSGEVIINPSQEVIEEFLERRIRCEEARERLLAQAKKPAITRDGRKVIVRANLELLDEIPLALDFGADGVGLFRTEYLYVTRKTIPNEEELFANYRQVVESLYPNIVTFRTLDLGGDKFAEELDLPEEINPALGLRAIRLCLKNPALFRIQLRAILRACAYGNVRIMFPLVSGIEELREAKKFLQEVFEELRQEGLDIEFPPCGAMIEIPTAVFIADHLAKEVDFFSIGTNDLIQYALAIDRGNEQVAHLYEPLHPGILRMVHYILEAGHRAGIHVAMCGEMAGELLYLPLLVGFGFDELSMNPQSIPAIKDYICALSFEECRSLCEEILQFASAEEVRNHLEAWLEKKGLLP